MARALATSLLLLTLFASVLLADEPKLKPTMGEFMGVNGHTIQFKADLYAKACRKVRDYHSLEWDLGKETDFKTDFPWAKNRVNWDSVYGAWLKEGFETDVCIMFNNTPPDSWKDLATDAKNYGRAFAKAFGPSSEKKLVTAAEIGNEPGHYSDEKYRAVFEAMASGMREGDPKLKVVTCNMTTGKSGNYDKSVNCVAGLEKLYDVLNIHTYAMAENWPTWRRSYPEDPKIEFLKTVDSLIRWRNEKAAGKEIWITEFGWDASTKPNLKTGDFAKWEGNVSDERQAQYLVRAFLVFAEMDVERAYLYFFNDSDEPSFHASSGITRNFEPKPSFHAVGHLYRSLNDYRFTKAVLKKSGEVYAYEFTHKDNAKKKVLVAWSPTGSARTSEFNLPIGDQKLVRAEKMPLNAGEGKSLDLKTKDQHVSVKLDESPIYLWLE